MTTKSLPPPGIWVPVPTFFVPSTSPDYVRGNAPLDLDTQALHTLFLARAGIRGLLLLGSTGEAIAISNAERITLIRHVRTTLNAAGFTNYPLMAGTATQGIEETITQLRDAAQAGADWGMVLAPGFFANQASEAGIVGWYEAVADASPLPILVYHFPTVSNNVKVTPSIYEKLAKHRNIVGCKLSHADLGMAAQVALGSTGGLGNLNAELSLLPGFRTFSGRAQQLLPLLAVGGAGAIDALSGIFPRATVRMFNLWSRGDMSDRQGLKEMRALQLAIARAAELVVKYGSLGIKSAAFRVLGLGENDGTRFPLAGGLSDAQWLEFDEPVKNLLAIEQALAEAESVPQAVPMLVEAKL